MLEGVAKMNEEIGKPGFVSASLSSRNYIISFSTSARVSSFSLFFGRRFLLFTHDQAIMVAIIVDAKIRVIYQPISAGLNWNILVCESIVAMVIWHDKASGDDCKQSTKKCDPVLISDKRFVK